MINGRDIEVRMGDLIPRTRVPHKRAARLYRFVSRLFAREAVEETIATRVSFNASLEALWSHVMLYEEVPKRTPFLLRALLPYPIRTKGEKTRVGATVRCIYKEGYLVKRITAVEFPYYLEFEVIEQHLGIEGCARTVGGCYQISACGGATEVELTTNYRAYLRPRSFWLPLEALLVRQLHRHILRGIRGALLSKSSADQRNVSESAEPQCPAPGGVRWKVSPSCSHR
jgi:hypothetical protein